MVGELRDGDGRVADHGRRLVVHAADLHGVGGVRDHLPVLPSVVHQELHGGLVTGRLLQQLSTSEINSR